MRLTKRECNDEAFFDEVFEKAEDLALAMKAGDYPYVVPVNFVQEKVNDVRRIYIHFCSGKGERRTPYLHSLRP